MFVPRRVPMDVIDLFMKIAFHATAYRRVELGEVADFHDIADFRFAICDFAAVFFDDAMIATISLASFSKGFTFAARSNSVSMINSSQNTVSSASSSTTPSLATNSAGSAVICCHRRAAPDQLGSDRSSLDCLRQRTDKFKNPQSELLRSLKEFAFSH